MGSYVYTLSCCVKIYIFACKAFTNSMQRGFQNYNWPNPISVPRYYCGMHMHLCAKVRSGCFALSALDNVIQQNLRTCTKKINHNMAMSYVYSNTNINIFKITFVHKLACTVATCIRIHTLFVGTTISAFFSIVLYGKRASMLKPWGSMVWGVGM